MTRSRWLMVSLGLGGLAAAAFGEPIALEATGLLVRQQGELRQAVLAAIEPSPGARLTVTCGTEVQTLAAERLPRFMDRLVVPVAPGEEVRQVRVELRGTDRQGSVELPPARRWELFIVPHTHLDIGFTDLQERVWTNLAKNLDEVIDICHKTGDWPEGARFRWTIEGTALFENFAERSGRDRVKALVELIRAGRVEVTACWVNLLTELAGPESLLRAMYGARRLGEEYGIRIETAMLNDVPGYTWSLPQIWSQMGVGYANLRANGTRAKFVWDRPGAPPRPFRWQGPDGSQVVCWYTDSYREANFLRRDFPQASSENDAAIQRMLYQNIRGYLRRAEQAGYDREVIQLRMGGDNLPPAESVCQWVRYWNQRWAYPHLRIATSREFFHALENDGRAIPVLSGDIPDWWADGAASSAEQTGQARVLHDQTVALETLCSLPGGPMAKPQTEAFAAIHAQLLLYTEHTWGASQEKYAKDPKQVEAQWAVKKGYVDRAGGLVGERSREWERAVVDWAKPAKDSVIVWNTLSWPRSGPVELPATGLPATFMLRDPQGRLEPVQRCGPERWCFVAREVPPLGYRLFEIEPQAAATPPPVESAYQVDFDTQAGAIRQIRHRPSGRGLLEPSPRFAFNQYLRESGGQRGRIMPGQLAKPRSPADKHVAVAEPAELVERIAGPVFDRMVTRTRGPGAPQIEQTITTYHGFDRVDMANRVRKLATDEVEGIYFAFPFSLATPQCRIEIPFTTMRPGVDQLRYSAADFYSIYHFVDLGDSAGGILWGSIEAPVVVFGDLWPECWHDDTRIDNGRLFSYAMNNYWFTNYRRQQGGDLLFRYALQAYAVGPDPIRSFRFGYELGTPLMAQVVAGGREGMVPMRSWLAVEPGQVMLLGVKGAEDGRGWIVRLLEVGVGDCTARVLLPPGRWSAAATDPTERGARRLSVTQQDARGVVHIALRRSEIATMRLDGDPPG